MALNSLTSINKFPHSTPVNASLCLALAGIIYNKVLSPLKKLSKQKNNYTAYLFNTLLIIT